jgi:hypothetical protein
METERKKAIYQLLEACREIDNSDLDAEKTAIIAELLNEVTHLTSIGSISGPASFGEGN